jgi:hypothetical protein
VTWGKNSSTTLSGTTKLRGSTESDVLVVPLDGEDCPYAASERAKDRRKKKSRG